MEKISERNRIFFLTALTVLLFVLLTIWGIFRLHHVYANQMIGFLGAWSETSEMPKTSVDQLLSGTFTDRNYKQGLMLLKEAGYQQSGLSLIYGQMDSVCLLWAFGAVGILAVLFAGLFFLYYKRKKFLNAAVEWVRNLEDSELEERVCASATLETRELVYVLREHRHLDEQERKCLEFEKRKTVSFVEDISHQLKTPLTIIRMQIERINYAQKFLQSGITKALTQVDKMVFLISMMMRVGMLNSGKSKMEIKRNKVWVLAEEIIQEFDTICQGKHVHLHSETSGEETFYYDDYWMKEAVENLIKNCIEYSEPEGIVSVKYHVGNNGLYIYVKDRGKGIEEQNIGHIFERYTSSYRQSDTSSGLGLAITKQVVESHFGEVDVRNNEDKGVTFKVYLPVMRGKDVYQEIKREECTEDDGNFAAG